MSFLGGSVSSGALQEITDEQMELLKKILGQVTPQVGEGIEAYPGTAVPGSNPRLDQLMSMVGDYPGSPLFTGSSDFLQKTLAGEGAGSGATSVLEQALASAGGSGASDVLRQALERAKAPDYGTTRDYWTDAFLTPTMAAFKKDVLPSIREQNIGQGTFRSGGRYRAETGAAGDLMTNLSGQLANIMFGEQQAGLEREANLSSLLANLMHGEQGLQANLSTALAGTMSGDLDRAMQAVPLSSAHAGQAMDVLRQGGLLERGMEGERLAEKYGKWTAEQPYNDPWLQYAMPLASQRTFENYMFQPQDPWETALAKTAVAAGASYIGGGGMGGTSIPYGGGGSGSGYQPMQQPVQQPVQQPLGYGGNYYQPTYARYGQMTYPNTWMGSGGTLY